MNSDTSSYEGELPNRGPQAPRHISVEQADQEARRPNRPDFVRVDEPANPGSENHIATGCVIG